VARYSTMIKKLIDWLAEKFDRGNTPQYMKGKADLEAKFKAEREKAMQDYKDEVMRGS
tara:strand:+ start:16 stop:189 length:174 start_codon:yes stop_codon:yes gene_type:complete